MDAVQRLARLVTSSGDDHRQRDQVDGVLETADSSGMLQLVTLAKVP